MRKSFQDLFLSFICSTTTVFMQQIMTEHHAGSALAGNCRDNTAFGLQQHCISPGILTSSHRNLLTIALSTQVSLGLPCFLHATPSLRNVFSVFTPWKNLAQLSKPSHVAAACPDPRGTSLSPFSCCTPLCPVSVHCGHVEEFPFRPWCP